MKKIFGEFLVLFCLIAFSSCDRAEKLTSAEHVSKTPLRAVAERHNVYIGAAVAIWPLRHDPAYANTLAREFDILTPEDAMKFGPLRPAPDQYFFDDADAIVDFAGSHGLKVRGHTLVWHHQLPEWLEGDRWSQDRLVQILQEHITTVVGRYRGRIFAWDVVNEAVADDGKVRDNLWLRVIGPEYIDMAFRWAHAADPEALLFYNDYGEEKTGPKSDAIYQLVKGLLQRGVPIHGVGFQLHVGLQEPPEPKDVIANMRRFAELGLQVHVTEMDVRITKPVTDSKLAAQAKIYESMMRICLEAPNCKAFVMWGFTDRYSWIPRSYPGTGSALIFDASYRPKAAYWALMDVLSEQ